MKNKKKKMNFKKIILVLLIISLVIYFYLKDNKQEISSNFNIYSYKTIKLDKNENYNGIGQEEINGKDGYFTTFTTLDNHKKIYKEYKQNGDSSWSNKEYWNGTMAENGLCF